MKRNRIFYATIIIGVFMLGYYINIHYRKPNPELIFIGNWAAERLSSDEECSVSWRVDGDILIIQLKDFDESLGSNFSKQSKVNKIEFRGSVHE